MTAALCVVYGFLGWHYAEALQIPPWFSPLFFGIVWALNVGFVFAPVGFKVSLARRLSRNSAHWARISSYFMFGLLAVLTAIMVAVIALAVVSIEKG